MLLEEYLSPAYWKLPTSNQPEDEFIQEKAPDWQIVSANGKPSSLLQLNNNILLINLLLEGTGNFAKVIISVMCNSCTNFDQLIMGVHFAVSWIFSG